jgi:hypothetical protein
MGAGLKTHSAGDKATCDWHHPFALCITPSHDCTNLTTMFAKHSNYWGWKLGNIRASSACVNVKVSAIASTVRLTTDLGFTNLRFF